MLRTQISLPTALKMLLDERSRETGLSIAELIRQAVTAAYGTAYDPAAARAAVRAAAGSWKNRDFDGEEYVERMRTGRRLDELDRMRKGELDGLDGDGRIPSLQ